MNKLYDLTNPQKSIWLTEEFYKDIPMQNITGSVIINEKINFKLLNKAVNLFVKNNDSCRLTFVKTADGIKQFFEDFKEFNVDIIDLSDSKDVKLLEKQISKQTFSLLNSSLCKFKLFRFPNGNGGFNVNIHHLISDAWTGGLIIDGIINIYSSLLKDPNFTEIPSFSYMDYIVSEQNYLTSNKYSKDKEFWNTMFKEIPDIAGIPVSNSHISTNNNSCVAKRKVFKLPKETINQINLFSKKYKSSPFNFFMGVFSLYIGRVSNLNTFVIGTPILNRSNFAEKHTTGMFISTVPFKVTIDNEIRFSDFISSIASDFFNIFRYQKYPYQHLLEDLRKSSSNVPNLYNILISYQNMRNSKQTSDIDFTSSWVHTGYTADDLDIHLFDVNDTGELNIAYDYQIEKYSIDDICSVHARILHIINQILENNEINLKDIEIVTPDEKKKLLYTFNDTQMDYPRDKTISQLFEEQVEKTPDNVAVVFGDQQLTYRELNERANSLANYLIDIGVKPNNAVGVHLEKSINYIVSIISILKIGATFVPLSVLHPKKRIEYILGNCNAQLLISNNDLSQDINYSCQYLDIETFKFNLEKANINISTFSSATAYILYTSGSTGNPKGVAIANYSLINHVYGINQKFDNKISSNDKTLSVANMSFDANIQEIFIPLLLGSTLHLLSDNSIYDIKFLANYIYQNNITFTFLPPNILDEIYNLLKDFDSISLDKLLVGVESIKYSTLNKFLSLNRHMQIHNGYGPTEATICCISYMYNSSNEIKSSDFLPIGTPLANTNILILNSNCNKLQPFYTPGEICILGDCLSSGYVNNSLNNGKFIVSDYYNKVMYKTGDYGYFLPNGNIMFVGRIDNQVKINGHRIELLEINNTIQSYTSINKAICLINNKHIICYFTADKSIDINLLKDFLKKSLPYYMIPFKIIQLDSFPTTQNGKINTKELLNMLNHDKSNFIKLPTNNVERTIYKLFSDLLNINSFSVADNFFELGGDSLSAIKLSLELSNIFTKDVSVQDIFANPTVELLATHVKNLSSSKKIIYIEQTNTDSSIVSSAQRRIYYASTIAGEASILYNTPGGVIFDKPLNTKKLESCINTLINRHESLRTKFDVKDSEIVQNIVEKIDFKLEILENPIEIDNLNDEFNNFIKPFDLSKAPLFRLKYINFSNGNSALFIDMHHIISDGTSLTIFVEELCKLYNQEELVPLNITYKDFANYENNKLKNGSFKEAEDFWVNQFKDDIPVLNMPTNYSRPSVKTYKGSKVHFKINSEITKEINALSKKIEVTPYMLLLSVYYILLSKYTGQDDIIVGTPVVGRDTPELYNIIGMFVNSLPIRAKIDFNISFKDFLNNVKNICLKDYKYQDYPFDELVNKLNIPRDTSRTPLFDTMFIYQNNGIPQINFKNIKSEYYIPDTSISKFDLSLEIIPIDNELQLSFEYCTNLFEKSFIENFASHYSNILHVVLDNLDIKLSNIDMLSEKEKNTILYKFNNTKMDYPKDKTISQLFEEQVEKTPDNIAIVFEDKKLTYKELNEKANSLAHYLRNSGICRNDIVGIMVNRSLEMIVAIISVLKSGGAYLLIDNTLPSDRVEYMLNNCNAKLLISDYDYKVNFENKINPSDIAITNSIDNLDVVNFPNDSFAIIYTSGSTGKPKGVLLHHTGIINLAFSFDKLMNFSALKNQLGFSSVSFDMFAVELFCSILLGRTLFLLNEEELKNPSKISKKIINNNIDFLITTPTKIELLLSSSETAKSLKVLKGFQLGGEILSPSLYEKLSSFTDAKIYNGYGPTEITACCSNKLIKSKTNINIGSANPNTSIYILDKDLNPCPIGVPGEIYVGGLGVAKGYVNDSQRTNSVFLKTNLSNDIIYKTGDIAKFTSKGEIQYIGRNDFQVKLKGLRIELSEIEKQFLSIDYITNCVVLADKTKTYLKAFFTATDELNIPSIRKQLLEKLPKYMVPNYIFQLDSIPITPNGKIDRKQLDEYKCKIIDNNTTYIEPETDTQKLFCSIWEDILKTKVGIDNNLFELGADSLSAIKFKVEALNNNIDIPYADIFKYKTVRKLSEKKSKAIESIPLENYDYTKINTLLKNNKPRLNYKITPNKNNNVLLLGSNGFVGMHIINSFIKNDSGNIYCVMRDKNNNSALDRFINTLHFYFGNTLDSYINKRIFIIKGNITKENFDMSKTNFEIITSNTSIVINAAANVKHYGNFDKFKNINIDSTINVINYCKKYNKRLLHLSTLSISGNMFLDGPMPLKDINKSEKIYFSENNLFINQSLDNVYTRSKFEAEKIILDNITNGLDAKILRLGNITSRFCDGVFQINPEDNAFVNRFRSIMELKLLPKSLLEQEVEFTPVDLCSEAIVKIMQYNSKVISVVHVYNSNHIKISRIIKALNELNIEIGTCSDEQFSSLVTSSNSKSKITGIVNDLTPDKKLKYSSNIKVKSNLSIDYLAKCNFRWKKIDKIYIQKYFKYLININFFKGE